MRAGFVADAHGNPAGLEGCLRALANQGADRIYFLGDAVGYFPDVNEVLDLLRSSDAVCVRGNHEAMLLGQLTIPEGRGAVYRLAEAGMRLQARHRAWIQQWPERLEVDLEGVRLLLVHGSPADPLQGYVYPDTDVSPLRALPFDGVLMGHTHRPVIASTGAVTVVNVGSSGMPRDVGDLASCAVYDSATRGWEILRVAFDAPALIAKWGDRIDATAAACLRRRAAAPVVGRTLPA
jgi:predicted phosphodiesterase